MASNSSCLGSVLPMNSGTRDMTPECLLVSATIHLCALIMQPAIIAGVTLGVTLLGVTIIKKSSGKSDEELKEDVKDAANQVKATGRDVWGFTKDKAGEVRLCNPMKSVTLNCCWSGRPAVRCWPCW